MRPHAPPIHFEFECPECGALFKEYITPDEEDVTCPDCAADVDLPQEAFEEFAVEELRRRASGSIRRP